MTPRLLTPEQAADLLPVGNADWIRRQLRAGVLRGSKLGGRWLVDEADVLDMVDAKANIEPRRRRRRRVA